jgi:hypothetical protein
LAHNLGRFERGGGSCHSLRIFGGKFLLDQISMDRSMKAAQFWRLIERGLPIGARISSFGPLVLFLRCVKADRLPRPVRQLEVKLGPSID